MPDLSNKEKDALNSLKVISTRSSLRRLRKKVIKGTTLSYAESFSTIKSLIEKKEIISDGSICSYRIATPDKPGFKNYLKMLLKKSFLTEEERSILVSQGIASGNYSKFTNLCNHIKYRIVQKEAQRQFSIINQYDSFLRGPYFTEFKKSYVDNNSYVTKIDIDYLPNSSDSYEVGQYYLIAWPIYKSSSDDMIPVFYEIARVRKKNAQIVLEKKDRQPHLNGAFIDRIQKEEGKDRANRLLEHLGLSSIVELEEPELSKKGFLVGKDDFSVKEIPLLLKDCFSSALLSNLSLDRLDSNTDLKSSSTGFFNKVCVLCCELQNNDEIKKIDLLINASDADLNMSSLSCFNEDSSEDKIYLGKPLVNKLQTKKITLDRRNACEREVIEEVISKFNVFVRVDKSFNLKRVVDEALTVFRMSSDFSLIYSPYEYEDSKTVGDKKSVNNLITRISKNNAMLRFCDSLKTFDLLIDELIKESKAADFPNAEEIYELFKNSSEKKLKQYKKNCQKSQMKLSLKKTLGRLSNDSPVSINKDSFLFNLIKGKCPNISEDYYSKAVSAYQFCDYLIQLFILKKEINNLSIEEEICSDAKKSLTEDVSVLFSKLKESSSFLNELIADSENFMNCKNKIGMENTSFAVSYACTGSDIQKAYVNKEAGFYDRTLYVLNDNHNLIDLLYSMYFTKSIAVIEQDFVGEKQEFENIPSVAELMYKLDQEEETDSMHISNLCVNDEKVPNLTLNESLDVFSDVLNKRGVTVKSICQDSTLIIFITGGSQDSSSLFIASTVDIQLLIRNLNIEMHLLLNELISIKSIQLLTVNLCKLVCFPEDYANEIASIIQCDSYWKMG
ncbi:MAG: hypothetical protein ACI4UM_08965 [Succinivibrio sp.]